MLRALTLLVALAAVPASARPPRLALIITVDALSTDQLLRMRPRLKGGLGRLLDRGALFTDTRYEYAEVHTASGHASIATGANPWRHGIVSNYTVERSSGVYVPIFRDADHSELGAPGPRAGDSSPRALLAETLGDRLRLATGGRAKVVSLSLKARSAIAMGGWLGQAWWFDESSGDFTTSTFYAKEPPAWMTRFNERGLARAAFGSSWVLSQPARSYLGLDDRPYEEDLAGMGRTFPHPLTGGLSSPGPKFYAAFGASPASADLLAQLAKAAIEGEKLGRDDVPDLLWVSFSHTDRVYHAYGPYSWEAQDALLRLDRTIGDLVATAERVAGKEHLLVVLSADHGGAAIPEEWSDAGLPAVRVNAESLRKGLAAELQARFGAQVPVWIGEGGIFIDSDRIAQARLDGAAVRRAAAEWLARQPSIAFAVARDDLARPGASSGFLRGVQLGYFPGRSGDVLYVLRQYHVISLLPVGTGHSTPYSYDSQVPAIFVGRDVKPGLHPARIHATDVAPTIAALLGISAPGQCEGAARNEALRLAR